MNCPKCENKAIAEYENSYQDEPKCIRRCEECGFSWSMEEWGVAYYWKTGHWIEIPKGTLPIWR